MTASQDSAKHWAPCSPSNHCHDKVSPCDNQCLELFPITHVAVKPSVLVRVGVSFITEEQACSNAETEIPDFDFAGVREAAFDTWNELLGRIQVQTQGVKSEIVELLYSSAYRTHISPADCKCEL